MNPTVRDDVVQGHLYDLFVDQVSATPAACAIVTNRETSYAQLHARVIAINEALTACDTTHEEAIGVLMERDVDLIAAMLAIWSVGCACVPLDPNDPAPRISAMISDAGCRRLLINAGVLDVLPEISEYVESNDIIRVDLLPDANSVTSWHAGYPTNQLAMIFHTSGSTGGPKGVELEHGGFTGILADACKMLEFGPLDRFLATAPVTYDVSLLEIFLPLTCGGSVLLRDSTLWLEPNRLASEIKLHRVTAVVSATSAWAAALSEVATFPYLRAAICGGEPISAGVAEQLASLSAIAWNCYGPTEVSIMAVGKRLLPDHSEVPNIGSLLAGAQALVVDRDNQGVAIGQTGELLLGGPGLARGYCSDPVLTNAHFVVVHGVRYFRTGDLVSIAPNGEFHFHGRIDDQVQVRGLRVEPGDIEATLNTHPLIKLSAVTRFTNSAGTPALAAGLITQNSEPIKTRQIMEWLADRLPMHMIPNVVFSLPALPVDSRGKLDRAELRRLAEQPLPSSDSMLKSSSIRISDSTTEVLISTWESLLNVSGVDESDNFFALGGDSLTAVRMVGRVEAKLGMTMPTKIVFESGTLGELASEIDKLGTPQESERSTIYPLAEQEGVPLLFFGASLELAGSRSVQKLGAVYAIVSWPLGRKVLGTGSIEELAALHVQKILDRWPSGALRIGGVEFCALLAFEVARQLRQVGREVEFVALLDPLEVPSMAAPLARVTRSGKIIALQVGSRVSLLGNWWYQLAHRGQRNISVVAEELVAKEDWPRYWLHERLLTSRYRPRSGHYRALVLDSGVAQRAISTAGWARVLGPETASEILPGELKGTRWSGPRSTHWLDRLSTHLSSL